MSGIWRLRAAVLILVGALAVHHGRYAFASAEREEHLASAHAYLNWLAPVAAVVLFLALVQLGVHVGRGHRGRTGDLPRAPVLWLASTATLLTIFGLQESLEALFSHGHLPAVAEILGDGGWTAIPFALVSGGLVAAMLRGAAKIVRWALTTLRRSARAACPSVLAPRPPALLGPRSVLARRLAGRGPPALS